MRTGLLLGACLAAAAAAAPLRAQDTAQAVRPGMSESDVRARWGEPVARRAVGEWTYLFYDNDERYYHDVVFLQGGQVVDAIVRWSGRSYLGQSSSPPGRTPVFTPPAGQATPQPASPTTVTGVRLTPSPE